MEEIRIFLSSPGDCADERAAIHAIVERLNQDPVVASFARISVIAWDWGPGVPLDALTSPQTSVNRQMPIPEACDIFIGIFRCRFGTPLPIHEFRRPDGMQYLSGSEYEFHRAWDARRRGGAKPEILMYRWTPSGSTSCPAGEQRDRLNNFFDAAPFKEGDQWTGSRETFVDTQEFSRKVEGHLRVLLSQLSPGSPRPLRDWLKERALILAADAGPRYTSNAHVTTDVGQTFDWLLMRKPAIEELDVTLSEVYKDIPATLAFDVHKKVLEGFAEKVRSDSAWWRTIDFEPLLAALEHTENAAWREIEQIEHAEKALPGSADARARESLNYRLRQTTRAARSAHELLKKYGPVASRRALVLTGRPGQGKTHTMVHEVCETVRMGGLAIGVLGQTLSSTGPLWDAVRAKIQWDGSIDQLLDSLENEAASRGERALILIDALNETPNRTRWSGELLGMTQQILRRPNLALAVSVRTDYVRQVIPETAERTTPPWVRWQHPGFAGIEPEALSQYFEYFGVKALAAPPLGEFNNPLYVQLLAKSLKGKELPHWQPSWLQVWDAWIERLEQDAVARLGMDDASRRRPLRRLMHHLAQQMIDTGAYTLKRTRADQIARELTGIDGVIGFLCSSGALIDHVDENDDELVEFGFERLSDTFIADRLLDKLLSDKSTVEARREGLKTALHPGGSLAELANMDWTDHPLRRRRAGLLEALCLAAPAKVGCELPQLIPPPIEDVSDWELSQAFIDSFRWRSAANEFGAAGNELEDLWSSHAGYMGISSQIDELIRLAVVPGHPLGMKAYLHPILLSQESVGERDALWSIWLPTLWASDDSNLRQLVDWACGADLSGIHPDVALPGAQLLTWMCAASQNGLRVKALRALTRMLAACPSVLPAFLPDFLGVNDPYVLEAVLIAVWGVMQEAHGSAEARSAAEQVYSTQFSGDTARHCHLTIRHYARRIVEDAHAGGLLPGVDLARVKPPYRCELPLNEVPKKDALEALSESKGFRAVIHSSTQWDFYRYIMGGNSPGSFEFSCMPLPGSTQPKRPFIKSESLISDNSSSAVFDLALAGRFVAWNALALGYTGERFDEFDTGYETREYGRSADERRTERIGKKYQWIGWYTLLAFLADNYELRPDWNKAPRKYEGPDQLNVHLFDPARWLHSPRRIGVDNESSWILSTLPQWPRPELEEMTAWISSTACDLPPTDLLLLTPSLPEVWGEGPWLRVAAEHTWNSKYAPGYWAKRQNFHADIWWQLTPVLVRASDLPLLLEKLKEPAVQKTLLGLSRIDNNGDWNAPLSGWPALTPEWDTGLQDGNSGVIHGWLPIPYRPLIGECGHPDQSDEHAPILVPTPSVIREWDLNLRLRDGLVLSNETPVFGLSSALNSRNALFARVEPLAFLLGSSGYSLVWFITGERRAFQNIDRPEPDTSVWANYDGIGYLTADGRPQVAWLHKSIERAGVAQESGPSNPMQ